MIIPICKIINIIPCHWVDSIPHGTSHCALSCTGEIGFQGRSSCVQVTANIGIVCPAVSEASLKLLWELLERWHFTKWLLDQIEPLELLMQDEPTENTLHHIGSIEAIHAVCTHVSVLSLIDSRILRSIELGPQIISTIKLSHKMSILINFWFTDIYQFGEIFPLHILAFSMEIEPDILQLVVFELIIQFGKLVANSQLAAFSIYKIDHVLLWIVLFSISKVLFCSHYRIWKVLLHLHWWCPLQIWLHAPY